MLDRNKRICVVTVNYHGFQDTVNCISSLEKSSELVTSVVVDNTPNDHGLVEALSHFSFVKLIQAPHNLGFGNGCNLGIDWVLDNTDCEFVFMLNNDASVFPDTIHRLVLAMDKYPEVGIVTGKIVLSQDPSVLWYGGGEVNWRRGSGMVPGVWGPADAPLATQSRYISFASGCAMLVRRSVLKSQKGFDHRFFMYEEDLEFSLRVQEAGWRIRYESQALVSHVGQGSQRKGSTFIGRYNHKNPNLPFLVYHGIKNCLLNMRLHAHSENKIKFYSGFPIFIAGKCIQWGIHGRFDALNSVFSALKDYWKASSNDCLRQKRGKY